MRLFVLSLPVLLMFGGAGWVTVTALRSRGASAGRRALRAFVLTSYGVGVGFLLWSGLVLLSALVHPSYPIIIGIVGGLLIGQGYIFARMKLL